METGFGKAKIMNLMKESGNSEKPMAMESKNSKMEMSMKASLKINLNMEEEKKLSTTKMSILETMSMENLKEMENIDGSMVIYIKDS